MPIGYARTKGRKTKQGKHRVSWTLRLASFVLCPFRLLALLGLIITLCSCAAQQDEPVLAGVGGSTPQGVVEGFVEDFNNALKELPKTNSVRRRYWSDRLAGYFAPSERADQRDALAQALLTFADSSKQLESDELVVLDVSYSSLELVQQDDNRAEVRMVDGLLRLKIVRVESDGAQVVLRSDERPFGATIGQPDSVVPLVRVNGRWFLTEG